MLEEVKTALRVSHTVLDGEINDLIDAARHDLMLSGISILKVADDTDPLIKRAVITYAKAHFITDDTAAERFLTSYNMLKNHLSLAGDYIGK